MRMNALFAKAQDPISCHTHAVGAFAALIGGAMMLVRALYTGASVSALAASMSFVLSMIALYSASAVYHFCPGNDAVDSTKRFLRKMDHGMIYILIAGSYTVIVLSALRPMYPKLAWGLLSFEWGLALMAATLTAIDLKKYEVFSMICYIGMGWAIIPFSPQIIDTMGMGGFGYLLAGGIAYTVGSILYGIGSKKRWMHSIFHIFVVLGSVLQFFAVLFYAL